MSMIFKQSEGTAARRRIPFVCVDATDGITPEVSLTFSAGDLKISKNGGTEANHAGTVAEIAQGLYRYEYTATELDTLGFITLRTNKSGVAIRHFFGQVIANDLNGNLFADVLAIASSTDRAVAQAGILSSCHLGVVEASPVAPTNSGSCVFQASGITEQTADHYNGRQVIFTTGVMAGMALRITDYDWDAVNSQGIFTCTVAAETPVDQTNFRIV